MHRWWSSEHRQYFRRWHLAVMSVSVAVCAACFLQVSKAWSFAKQPCVRVGSCEQCAMYVHLLVCMPVSRYRHKLRSNIIARTYIALQMNLFIIIVNTPTHFCIRVRSEPTRRKHTTLQAEQRFAPLTPTYLPLPGGRQGRSSRARHPRLVHIISCGPPAACRRAPGSSPPASTPWSSSGSAPGAPPPRRTSAAPGGGNV